MTKVGKPEKMIVNGKRLDGRSLDEFRPISLEVGNLKRAEGSAIFRFGNTHALSAVFGPQTVHPRHIEDPQKAVLKCRYSMIPFSTKERIRPGPSRRSSEISKVLRDALSNVIFFEDYPKTLINVYVEIIQADGTTRCAGLNAASLAMADAGIPMKNLVTSCSVGKIDEEIILDVAGLEDNYGDVDMAVAMIGNEDKVVLLQMDGIITKEDLKKMLDYAKKGCAEIFEKQKQVLKEKYKTGEDSVEDE
jgi:exosome complex component RRP41